MASEWHLEHLYHTVINVKDLDDSIAFYKKLGFEVLNDRRHIDWPDFVGKNFGMNRAKGRGVLMVLPSDPNGPMLDLIEWLEPKAKFPSSPPPADEVPRILAFRTKNVHAAYEQLSKAGVTFTRDMWGPHEELGIVGVCCCHDPNGNLIELIELKPGQRHSRAESLEKR